MQDTIQQHAAWEEEGNHINETDEINLINKIGDRASSTSTLAYLQGRASVREQATQNRLEHLIRISGIELLAKKYFISLEVVKKAYD